MVFQHFILSIKQFGTMVWCGTEQDLREKPNAEGVIKEQNKL